MADTETLERIAKLLPQQQREQFFAMITRFKSVPDDDEYLQILQAIGFMTLLWKEVPNEVSKILEGANPVNDTCHSIAKQIREAVVDAIPSYEDLMLISKRLEEHELALKRTLSTLQQTKGSHTGGLLFATLLGVFVGIGIYHYLSPFIL